jgi:hypothetical protein
MSDNDNITIPIKFTTDSGSASRAQAALDAVRVNAQQIQRAFADISPEARQAGAALESALGNSEVAMRALIDQVETLQARLDKLDATRVDVEVRQTQTTRNTPQALETADQLGTFGSQIAGGLGNSELGNLAGLFGDVAGAAATLNPILIAGAAAVGGAAVVFGELTRRLEQVREAAKAYSDELAQEIDLILSGATSRDVTGARDDAQARADLVERNTQFLQALLADLTGTIATRNEVAYTRPDETLIDELNASIVAQQERIRRELEITDESVDVFAALGEVISTNTRLQATYTDRVSDLNELLVSGSLAVNDANAAQERMRGAAEVLSGWLERGAQAMALLSDAGEDVVEQFNAARDAEIEKIRAYDAAVRAMQADRQAEAVTEYLDALTLSISAQEDLNEALAAVAQVEQETADKVGDIRAGLAERLLDVETTRGETLAEAEAEAAEARLEIAEDSAEALARVAKISGRDYATAVAERDALAAAQVQQSLKDTTEDQAEADTKALKQLEKRLDKEAATVEKRTADQIATLQRAAERQLAQVRESSSRELQLRQQAVVAAEAQVRNAEFAKVALYAQAMRLTEQTVSVGLSKVVTVFDKALGLIYNNASQFATPRTGTTSLTRYVEGVVDRRVTQIITEG